MLFRYPGGKSRISKQIVPRLASQVFKSYSEPFAGGASVGLRLLCNRNIQSFSLNDIDYGIYSIWKAIHSYPRDLIKQILCFTPTPQSFFDFRHDLLYVHEDVPTTAFKKLALHQISYSGLGVLAGGPIGGKSQKSQYAVGCRWNPDRLITKIEKIHGLLRKPDVCTITNESYELHMDADLLYLDPPFYEQGDSLYLHKFRHDQHAHLARQLQERQLPWFVSYDDNNTILLLYAFANIIRLRTTYTINSARQRDELLITNTKNLS